MSRVNTNLTYDYVKHVTESNSVLNDFDSPVTVSNLRLGPTCELVKPRPDYLACV